MTNREWIDNKKEKFFEKASNFFSKYHLVIFIVFIVADVASLICTFVWSLTFLLLDVPLNIFIVIYGWCEYDEWLDKEHKEKV